MKGKFIERKYLGKEVAIGIPHWDKPGKLFYYYGLLAEVTDDDLVVFTDKQMIRIDWDKVEDIYVTEDANESSE